MERKDMHAEGTLALVNVSKGGVAFISSQPAKENDIFELQIFLKKKRFNLRAAVVYCLTREDGYYNIGAKFIDVPENFKKNLEQEIKEISEFHRECNQFYNKGLNFTEASMAYLRNISPGEA